MNNYLNELLRQKLRMSYNWNPLPETSRTTYITHIRRGMVLQEKIDRIRYNDPSVLTIVEDESSQFLAVLRSAGGRYVSIDFEMGYILEGIVEDVDEDTRQVTLSSVFEYDPFDLSGFYYDVC